MTPELRQKVLDFLGDVKTIPTLPDVYFRVKKAFEDPSVSVDYLADAIRYDQALTISILRLVNSPLFGFRSKISSMSQAIMMIGLREVYSLVLSISVMGLFPIQEKEEEVLFPAKQYWAHSLGVGVMAKLIAKTMNMTNSEELFVAGLIHDIGKLIMKINNKEVFDTICQKAREDRCFFYQAEQKVLGFTHADVGAVLAENWKFPEILVVTTGGHHNPDGADTEVDQLMTSIIQVSDSLVRSLGWGWGGDPFVTPVSMETMKRLHLVSFHDLGSLVSKAREEYDAALQALVQ